MNDPMVRPFVGALVAALALVTAPATAQEPPASTTQEPTVPQQAVEDDENPWALAVLIVGGVCVVVGMGGGLFAARGRMGTLSEGESARRLPHPVFARSTPGDAQAGFFSPFAQPGISARESSDSVSDEQGVAPGPKRAAADGAQAGVDDMAAQGERVGFAWEEPEARTAQEPEQLAEEERTILFPIVEPQLLVVEEAQAPPSDEIPGPEPADAEEREGIAEARPEAIPEVQLEPRADETAAEPEPEVAVPPEADDAPEEAPAVPAVEEGPTPVEEKPGEPVAANKPAPRARKKPVKARPNRPASKVKEVVPPAQPKPSRRRPLRDPPADSSQ